MQSPLSPFSMMLAALLASAAALGAPVLRPHAADVCPRVATQGGFNLTEWVRASWFIQEQQVNGFQQPENLYCVVATYELEGRDVPLWEGTVVSVYNYANTGAVNGPGSDPEQEPLCARLIDPEQPSNSIVNAPCFLPNALAGPYWVVAAGPSPDRYEWGIVSGGQPVCPNCCINALSEEYQCLLGQKILRDGEEEVAMCSRCEETKSCWPQMR